MIVSSGNVATITNLIRTAREVAASKPGTWSRHSASTRPSSSTRKPSGAPGEITAKSRPLRHCPSTTS